MSAGNLFNSNSATDVKTALAGDNTTETLFKTNIQYVVDEVASNYSRLETAEPKITTLETDLNTLETTVGNLSSPTIPPNGVSHIGYLDNSSPISGTGSYSLRLSINDLPLESDQFALVNLTFTQDTTGLWDDNADWGFKVTAAGITNVYERTNIHLLQPIVAGSFVVGGNASTMDFDFYWISGNSNTRLLTSAMQVTVFEDWNTLGL